MKSPTVQVTFCVQGVAPHSRINSSFIERLWRSLKYEAVYLHELADGFAAERVIAAWMTFYNHVRPHSALGGRTPAEAYCEERAA